MSIAAVPNYLPDSLRDAAPGHRFNLYLPLWQEGSWQISKSDKTPALKSCTTLGESAKAQVAALRSRQQALIKHYGADGYCICTQSTAPFATGLGNEHPIENGFAFLTPYGLPYLAGSGVKGILRRAMEELMEELMDDGDAGFTDVAINALFGPEEVNQPEDAQRGALDFWDVFPNPDRGKLVVEIMTPHYGKYYQGEEPPHDSGAPIPVSFLAVPAKSNFDFHVVCHAARLPAALQTQWRGLLDGAFKHAFEWVGFGAKTSVGYGAMAPVAAAVAPAAPAGAASTAAAFSSDIQIWPTARLTFTPNTGEIKASFDGKMTVGLKGSPADALRAALGDERATRLKKRQELKDVAVEVQQEGNKLTLNGLAAP